MDGDEAVGRVVAARLLEGHGEFDAYTKRCSRRAANWNAECEGNGARAGWQVDLALLRYVASNPDP